MFGWQHQHNEHKSEQTLGHSERQGSLVCFSPCGCQELNATDWTTVTKFPLVPSSWPENRHLGSSLSGDFNYTVGKKKKPTANHNKNPWDWFSVKAESLFFFLLQVKLLLGLFAPDFFLDLRQKVPFILHLYFCNREEKTWFHVGSVSFTLSFVLCCLDLVMLTLYFCKRILPIAWNTQKSLFSKFWPLKYNILPFR